MERKQGEQALNYLSRLRAQPDNVEALFQLGRAISQQGRHDEAILVLAWARSLAPQRAEIIYTLATTSAQAGKPTGAAGGAGERMLTSKYTFGRVGEVLVPAILEKRSWHM